MKIYMPHGAKKIINRLRERGYTAYIVGGCVRDALLGKRASDFDITTSAHPEKIKEIFSDKRVIETGIKHGTVTVIENDGSYEITTFRKDGAYLDNRHPETVSFSERIEDDLCRRDFTVNAMAYNEECGIIDLFFGKEDLEKKIIRAVGEPSERFSEDALRIMRALRFASCLNFSIDEKTSSAIHSLRELIKNVSCERVFEEWKKLLQGCGAYRIISEYSDVIRTVFPELYELHLPNEQIFSAEQDFQIRQLLIFSKNCTAEEFSQAMLSMRSDRKTERFGNAVLHFAKCFPTENEKDVKKFILRCGDDGIALAAAKVAVANGGTEKAQALIEAFIKENIPRRIDMLNIRGKDILSLGVCGERVGKILGELLFAVCLGELENEKSKLLEFAAKLK